MSTFCDLQSYLSLSNILGHACLFIHTLRKHAHVIYRFTYVVKIESFQDEKNDIFIIFAQNKDCGHTLEPPRRGGSNKYPQSMFCRKNKKNRYTPAYPSFFLYKSGVQGGIHFMDIFSWCS